MSAANGSAVPGENVTNTKGKGKAVEQSHDMSMDEDDDSSEEEESGNEEPVRMSSTLLHQNVFNIVTGSSKY